MVIRTHFKDDNVFTSNASISFSHVLHRTRRLLFVRFFFFLKKRRNFNIFMPSRVLLLGFALVAGRVKIQVERN